mgnify:CR=1 FL=1
MKKKIKSVIKLMRPKHWLKNALIFFPILFDSKLFVGNIFYKTFIGCISFCFISSAIYIINDIKDVEKDRLHKTKKKRPIAAGDVSIKEGILIFCLLVILTIAINVFIIKDLRSMLFIFLYFVLNILYSFGLKNIPIIDVIILVSGFVIRVMYGASITSIKISQWLYLTVMSGSFFMGFGKRRNEIIKQGNDSRKVLKYYTKEYLDKFMYVCLVLTLMFYSLWSIDSLTILRFGDCMPYTIPFVLIIFMKYCLDIEGDSFGDPVDVITSDKILMSLIASYGLIIFLLIYVR